MTTRINKALAKDIADKLTTTHQQVISDLEKQFSDAVREVWLNTIPDSVIQFVSDNPGWIDTTTDISLHGHGFYYHWVHIPDPVPENMGSNHLEVGKELTKLIGPLYRKIEKKKEEIKELQREIYTTVLNLRTEKNVRAEFPEAAAYLPPGNTVTALAVNVDKLREKLLHTSLVN